MADDAPFIVPAVIDDVPDATARVPDKFREVQWTRLRSDDASAAFAARMLALLTGAAEPKQTKTHDTPSKPSTAETKTKPTVIVEPAPTLDWRPAPDVSVPGTKWMLERKLGEGGFGEVWLGRHQTMKEHRVFKFCFREDHVRSLKRELTLFRVLKERVGGHPNIVRLLDVHFDEPPFYVEMDYVEGQSLKVWCEQQGGVEKIPLAARLEIVAQIADALHAAHTAGVIHRDVKPGNILIAQSATPHAQPTAKLSDFGIGQVTSEDALSGVTKSGFTQSIVVDSSSARSGTQLYMAPELAAGVPASVRSDLYSLGVVLFQLVVGDMHRPLTTDWSQSVDDPMLREDLTRCFASRSEERFASADLLAQSLRAFESRRAAFATEQAAAAARQRAAQRWRIFRTAAVAVVVVGLGASLIWFLQRNSKLRWARQQALPEISRLLQANEISAAFALAIEAEKYLPDDPALTNLWQRLAAKASVETTPAGADVYTKEYRKPNSEWRRLGKSPLKDIRVSRVFYRWQIRKEGYETLEQAVGVGAALKFSLDPTGAIPPGMVRVQGTTTSATFTGLPSVQLDDYSIDRHEVTNRQFKEFVDRGGYANADYWKQSFVKQGKTLTRAEAMAEFRDLTGQPGPAKWKNGTFPDGEADHPVTGISWFEAAAYAEFAGKRLPSIYHWRSASLIAAVESIVPLSNFAGKGLARVGSYQGMSACGAFDMAGNAKEWCWNEAGPETRYILGGAWREPDYMFTQADALSPFDRSAVNGFRCIKLLTAGALPTNVDDALVPVLRNFANEQPVSDEAFRIFRSLYSYDKTALDPRVETSDDSENRWRKERISFNAAYGNERMAAIVFLPKKSPSPCQVVIYFPGTSARQQPSSERLAGNAMDTVNLVVGSGRAFIRCGSDTPKLASAWLDGRV
ncbi:MAG: hypothetical protein EXS32_00280 [Opitutus sp.]|nr:hypothetical protein [Opitutus sp.]